MTRRQSPEERELREIVRNILMVVREFEEVSKAITDAILAERERCLQKFKDHVHDDDRFGCDCVNRIYEAIRKG